jgi:hypothetical protein
MKKLLLLTFVLGLILSTIGKQTYAATSDVQIFINGTLLKTSVAPIIENGTTLVQFRPVFEKLGLKITWDNATRTVTGTKEGLIIVLVIDSTLASVNGQKQILTKAPNIVNGNTMIPLRFIGEATGKEVQWHGDTHTITISGPEFINLVKQYGNESYQTSENTYEYNIKKTIKFEKDGYFYILWSEDDSSDGQRSFKTSVGKDGKWIIKEKTIFQIPTYDDNMRSLRTLFLDNNIFYSDSIGLKRITFDVAGEITFNDYVNKEPIEYPYLHPVQSADQKGFIYGKDDSLNLYLINDLEKPIPVKDIHKQALNFATTLNDIPIILDKTHTYISYYAGGFFSFSLKQLNIQTGDLVYDDDGQDKYFSLLPTGTSTTGMKYVFNKGIYYVFYQTQMSSKSPVDLVMVDENFKLLGSYKNIGVISDNLGKIDVTFKGNEMHIWDVVDFQRKTSIQLTTLSLPQ